MLVDATGVCATVLAVVTEKRVRRETKRDESMAMVQVLGRMVKQSAGRK